MLLCLLSVILDATTRVDAARLRRSRGCKRLEMSFPGLPVTQRVVSRYGHAFWAFDAATL